MSFQVVNTDKSNTVYNSCVFSLFEAPDNDVNLRLALDQYRDIIFSLQETQWKLVKDIKNNYCYIIEIII